MIYMQRSLKDDLPPDAIVLTRSEVIAHQWKNISEQNMSDVWPLRFGKGLMGIFVGAQSLYITTLLRRRVNLLRYGYFSMTLPMVMAPAMLTTYLHYKYVVNEILLQHECPICLTTQSCVLHVLAGLVYPAAGGCFMSVYYAKKFGTFNVPSFSNPSQLFKGYLALLKPLTPKFYPLLALNLIFTFGLIKLETDALVKMNDLVEKKHLQIAKEMYFKEKRRRSYNV